jgi:hypothetical protein
MEVPAHKGSRNHIVESSLIPFNEAHDVSRKQKQDN